MPSFCWAVVARSWVTRSPLGAMRALGLLAGGVGTDGRALHDLLGVHHDLTALHAHREAVKPARGRATLLLAHPVVLRAVARALEPLRALAPRHPASEVDAPLVERHHPGLHPFEHAPAVDGLGLGDVVLGIGVDVEAALGNVERLPLV